MCCRVLQTGAWTAEECGCLLASASEDATVRVWTMVGGRCMMRLADRQQQQPQSRGAPGGDGLLFVHSPVSSVLFCSSKLSEDPGESL